MASFDKTPEIKRLKEKLTIDLLWLYIMKILSEQPLHGYVIRKEIGKKFGFFPGNVTSYVVLYKLKNRGFVKVQKIENKSVYHITEKGEKLFSEGKKQWKKYLEKIS